MSPMVSQTCCLPGVTFFTIHLCELSFYLYIRKQLKCPLLTKALQHLFYNSLTCLCALWVLPNGLQVTQVCHLPPYATWSLVDHGRDFQSPYSTSILLSSLVMESWCSLGQGRATSSASLASRGAQWYLRGHYWLGLPGQHLTEEWLSWEQVSPFSCPRFSCLEYRHDGIQPFYYPEQEGGRSLDLWWTDGAPVPALINHFLIFSRNRINNKFV